MEKLTDNELIARIRRSDEEAFYALCHRYWKSLYIYALAETGSREEAFEEVKRLFAGLWDRRRSLPEKVTSVEEYLSSRETGKRKKGSDVWNLNNLVEEAGSHMNIKKLPGLLSVFLGNRHFSVHEGKKD